jgi:hypothetical protein
MVFKTIADVRAANRANGGNWFSRGTMRFFGARIESKLYKGGYFITSESYLNKNSQRKYSVRKALSDGSIVTVGEFNSFTWKIDAINHLRYAQMGLVK